MENNNRWYGYFINGSAAAKTSDRSCVTGNFMFSGTVAENIAIHCPGATIEQIMEVARIAGAHDLL